MTRLILSAVAVCAILATATTMLRSHPHESGPAVSGMTSLRDMHLAASKTKLPSDDYEDMALVYTAPLPPR
ncbi:MAG TPA: hypothetical protein VIQ05_03625 [Tardiphaga sp.]